MALQEIFRRINESTRFRHLYVDCKEDSQGYFWQINRSTNQQDLDTYMQTARISRKDVFGQSTDQQEFDAHLVKKNMALQEIFCESTNQQDFDTYTQTARKTRKDVFGESTDQQDFDTHLVKKTWARFCHLYAVLKSGLQGSFCASTNQQCFDTYRSNFWFGFG